MNNLKLWLGKIWKKILTVSIKEWMLGLALALYIVWYHQIENLLQHIDRSYCELFARCLLAIRCYHRYYHGYRAVLYHKNQSGTNQLFTNGSDSVTTYYRFLHLFKVSSISDILSFLILSVFGLLSGNIDSTCS